MIVTGDRDAYQLPDDGRVQGDDDLARDHRHARLRPRGRDRALRHPAGAGARLHRAEGRHLRQHPRRSRASATRPPPSCCSSTGRSRRCSPTSTRSPARSARRTCARTPSWRASRRSSRPCKRDIDAGIDVTRGRRPSRPTARGCARCSRDFELRDPLRRLEEALGRGGRGAAGARARASSRHRRAPASLGRSRRRCRTARRRLPPRARTASCAGPRLAAAEVLLGRGREPRRAADGVGRAAADRARLEAVSRAAGPPLGEPRATRLAPERLAPRHDGRRLPDQPRAPQLPARRAARGGGHRAGRSRATRRPRAARRSRCSALAACSRQRDRARSGCGGCSRRSSCRWSRCSAGSSAQGVKLDTVPAGEIAAGVAERDRGARARDLGAGGRGVHDRLATAAQPDPVREAGPDAQAARQDRLLDRRARAARDPRRAPDRREGRVAGASCRS